MELDLFLSKLPSSNSDARTQKITGPTPSESPWYVPVDSHSDGCGLWKWANYPL